MTPRTCIGDANEACDRPAVKRDRCDKHYLRWYRNTPAAGRSSRPRLGLTPIERFYTHVNLNGPLARNRPDLGPCHLWKDGTDPKGYGIFWADGTTHRAHIWIYEQKVGPVPPDREMDHFACDTTGCVNFLHERPVTHRENTLRSDGPAALNLAKMECEAGHELAKHGRINSQGSRECKLCKRKQQRRMQQAKRNIERGYVPLPAGTTVCPAGHDLTAEDAAYVYHGQLVCMICTAPRRDHGGRRPLDEAA